MRRLSRSEHCRAQRLTSQPVESNAPRDVKWPQEKPVCLLRV